MNATTNPPTQIITVMADYGFGPYAWLKDASDTTELVGPCVATGSHGFELEPEISKQLQQQFAEWVSSFEQFCERPSFDWETFHTQGLLLSRAMFKELKGRFRVVYAKPIEDPNHETQRRTEITDESAA